MSTKSGQAQLEMRSRNTCTYALALLLVASSAALAQDVNAKIDRLRAPSDSVRRRAFYELVQDAAHGQPVVRSMRGPRIDLLGARARGDHVLGDALVAQLEHENALVRGASHGVPLPASYDAEGYYVDLMMTVADMRDRRTIKALIPGLGFSGPVKEVIVSFGAPVIPYVRDALHDDDRDVRAGAAQVLGLIAAGEDSLHITTGQRDTIRDALIGTALSADEAFVRQSAVVSLMNYSDASVRLAMQHVAEQDAVSTMSPNGTRIYPVRAAASQWLARHSTKE